MPITLFQWWECPKCSHKIQRTFMSSRDKLGAPKINCGNCGQLVETELQEWEDMTAQEQRFLWLKRLFWGGAASFLIAVTLGLLVGSLATQLARQQNWIGTETLLAPWFIIGLGIPAWTTLMFVVIRKTRADVSESVKRSAKQAEGSMQDKLAA